MRSAPLAFNHDTPQGTCLFVRQSPCGVSSFSLSKGLKLPHFFLRFFHSSRVSLVKCSVRTSPSRGTGFCSSVWLYLKPHFY